MRPDLNRENMSFMKKGTYILTVPFWSSCLVLQKIKGLVSSLVGLGQTWKVFCLGEGQRRNEGCGHGREGISEKE